MVENFDDEFKGMRKYAEQKKYKEALELKKNAS